MAPDIVSLIETIYREKKRPQTRIKALEPLLKQEISDDARKIIESLIKAEAFRQNEDYPGARSWYAKAGRTSEAREMDLLAQNKDRKTITPFIHEGNKVCELFYGNHADIIEVLSEIVKEKGAVYAVDGFPAVQLLREDAKLLEARGNVIFIQAKVPPLPNILKKVALDAFVAREFLWGYKKEAEGTYTIPTQLLTEIHNQLSKNGYLILLKSYPETDRKFLDKLFPGVYRTVFQKGNDIVFQKTL